MTETNDKAVEAMIERLREWSVPNHKSAGPRHDCHAAAEMLEAMLRDVQGDQDTAVNAWTQVWYDSKTGQIRHDRIDPSAITTSDSRDAE